MYALVNSASMDVGRYQTRFNLIQGLFVLSAFLAPLEIKLVANLTVYDILTLGIGLMLITTETKSIRLPGTVLKIAFFVFLLFAMASAYRSTYPLEALTQTIQFAFIFFVQLPVILSVVKTKSLLKASLIMYLLGTLVLMVWAMVTQQDSGFHHRIRTFHSDNPNPLGYATAYMLPFVLHFMFEKWRQGKFVSVILLAPLIFYPMIWALTASGSRSSTVSTLAALIMFLSFRGGFEINLKMLLRILFVILIIACLGYVIASSDYFPAILWERIERTMAMETTLIDDRKRLAIAGWRAFVDSPFIGVGLDNFRYVATHYDVPLVTPQSPHNLWLQFLAQIGIVGTLAFLVIIVYWMLWLFRAQRAAISPSQRELFWAFIASFSAIMMLFMFVPIMIQRQYWLIYGLGIVAISCFEAGLVLVGKTTEINQDSD